MVKIALKTLSEEEFINVLNNQFNALLKGGSLDDIDVFKVSKRSLRGSGFLDIIQSIGKFVLPAVKKYLAPAAAEFAHGLISDLSQGKNIKTSMKTRGKAGLSKIGSQIISGKGLKRKYRKRTVKRLNHSHKHLKRTKRGGSSNPKRKSLRKKCASKKKCTRKSRTNSRKRKYHDIFS